MTDSNIVAPFDSQLLANGICVLSRLLFQSNDTTGVKIRFTDERDKSKSLSYRILHAKKAEKDALHATLLGCPRVVCLNNHEAPLKRSDLTQAILKMQNDG